METSDQYLTIIQERTVDNYIWGHFLFFKVFVSNCYMPKEQFPKKSKKRREVRCPNKVGLGSST